MLGILLLFFIGKYFYKLAEEYRKSKWGFAVLGIVTYYGGTFIYGIFYGIIYFAMNPEAFEDDIDTWTLRLTAVAAGIGFALILYFLLERSWKRNIAEKKTIDIDEIGSDTSSEE